VLTGLANIRREKGTIRGRNGKTGPTGTDEPVVLAINSEMDYKSFVNYPIVGQPAVLSQPGPFSAQASSIYGAASRPKPVVPDYEMLRVIGRGACDVWLAHSILADYRAVEVWWREFSDEDRGFIREFGGIRRFEPISRSHPSHFPDTMTRLSSLKKHRVQCEQPREKQLPVSVSLAGSHPSQNCRHIPG